MKRKILPVVVLLLMSLGMRAQLIQGTIRQGAAMNEVEVWIKPDFNNLNVRYLFQLGFPIAFPTTPPVQPTSLSVTLDPSFTATFGNNYSVTVNPMAHNLANTENYFNIVLIRTNGAGTSSPQTWNAGTEYKVLTAAFNPTNSPGTQVKLADYQDGGSDALGNFYTQDDIGNYYVTSNSVGNFYSSPGQSLIGGTASAGFVQTTSNVPLPVNLLRFNGYRNGNKNLLEWSTEDELNNKGFEVQRSTDGSLFSTLGFVKAKTANGSSSIVLSYSFEDYNPDGQRQYYRLRQVDIDGRGKLSQVLVINGDKPAALSIGSLFPVPARNKLTVIVNAPREGKIELMIANANGQLIRRQIASVGLGANSIPLNIDELTSGNYIIYLKDKVQDQVLSVKFIKE